MKRWHLPVATCIALLWIIASTVIIATAKRPAEPGYEPDCTEVHKQSSSPETCPDD